MAEYQILYWQEIPSVVMAQEGRQNRVRIELPPRFQAAIDEAAVRAGLTDADAYSEQWRRGDWQPRAGSPETVASEVAAEIEAEFPPERLRALLAELGPAPAAPALPAGPPAHGRLLDWLAEGQVVVGDGAMGTMLQAAGLTDGSAPEVWNVEQPERVRAIYQAYADAGAQAITTNTFGGSRARLRFHGVDDRVHELNLAGARLARAVADAAGALVAGDIGPTGDLIEPVGPLSMEEAQAIFAEQAAALIAGGADYILIETMSHLNEVKAAVLGVRQVDPAIPIATTMSFDTNYHTMMGVSPRQALETIAGWGVQVIGANCGNGPAEIEVVMTQMAQHRPAGVYLMAQSNAGLPHYVDGRIQYDATPAVMADFALKLRSLGVNFIGACCGSTPAHTAAMRQALDAASSRPVEGPNMAPTPPIESAEGRAARSAARRQARRGGNDERQ